GCPSIGTFAGIGYGLLSLSSEYANRTRDFGVDLPCTTVYGMPMREPSHRPLPKSACTPESPIEEMIVAELVATGSLSTRWFHALVAGNTWQPPIVGGVGVAPETASDSAAVAATSSFFTVAGVDVPSGPRMP